MKCFQRGIWTGISPPPGRVRSYRRSRIFDSSVESVERRGLKHAHWTWGIALAIAAATVAVYLPVLDNGFVNYDDDLYILNNPHVQRGLGAETVSLGVHHLSRRELVSPDVALVGGRFRALRPRSRGLPSHEPDPPRREFGAALLRVRAPHGRPLAERVRRRGVRAASPARRIRRVGGGAQGRPLRPVRRARPARLRALRPPRVGLLSGGVRLSRPGPDGEADPRHLALRPAAPGRVAARAPARPVATPSAGTGRGCAAPSLEKLPLFALVGAISAVAVASQSHWGTLQDFDRLPAVTPDRQRAHVVRRLRRRRVLAGGSRRLLPAPRPFARDVAGGRRRRLLCSPRPSPRSSLRRRHPEYAVGWFWYLGVLVPVIGLVQVGQAARADRYTYLPLIGLSVPVVWAAAAVAIARAGGARRGGGGRVRRRRRARSERPRPGEALAGQRSPSFGTPSRSPRTTTWRTSTSASRSSVTARSTGPPGTWSARWPSRRPRRRPRGCWATSAGRRSAPRRR